MSVRLASESAPGRPANEDAAFTASGLVGVLDGVSVPDGVDTGCRHGPAWYVQRLSEQLVRGHNRDPEAPLARLLTDGASAAVEQFELLDWPGLLDVLTDHGPQELIRLVREAEAADHDGHARPRYKRHDDATAALCLFEEDQP
jgi:hypothetical protein